MADAEKKGLTVKIDADLHAEVRQYLDAHEMTMRAGRLLSYGDHSSTVTLGYRSPDHKYGL